MAHGVPKPSAFWVLWQSLKGANFRHLKVPDADLRSKWIIVTGANSGIGREAALQFARWGANVILACREKPPPHEPHPDVVVQECQDAAKMAGHQEVQIECWVCDMDRLSSVQAFGERWLATGRPLDILANNAGIGGRAGAVVHTEDGFGLIQQVNFLSHVLLTMVLLPSLKKAAEPRIICTVSVMHYLGDLDLAKAKSGKNSYANNKLYYQTWLTELQSRMTSSTEYKHITIQGVHPGIVKTNIWKESEGKLMQVFGIDAQQGSIAITYPATSPELGKGGGNYVNRIWQEEPMPQTKNEQCRREIWEYVEKELKLQERGIVNM